MTEQPEKELLTFNSNPLHFLFRERRQVRKRLKQKELELQEEVSKKRYVRPFEKLMQQQQQEDLVSKIKGDRILLELRLCLKCFKTRSKQQVIFHESFIQANLKNIYGDDFLSNEIRIKHENLIDQIQEFALVCCPRRFGKTTAVAMFIAAYLICCEDAKVVVFSPGKRQSSMLLKLIIDKATELRDDFGYNYQISQQNAEVYAIVRNGFEKIVRALPAKEEVSPFYKKRKIFIFFLKKTLLRVLYVEEKNYMEYRPKRISKSLPGWALERARPITRD